MDNNPSKDVLLDNLRRSLELGRQLWLHTERPPQLLLPVVRLPNTNIEVTFEAYPPAKSKGLPQESDEYRAE